MEVLAISVGIGLVLGLAASELLGLASGGLIVPGYLALYLLKPMQLLATFIVAFATLATARLIASFLIVHGRRRTALMILLGYLLGMLLGEAGMVTDQLTTIGFIIPGLIAIWMDRQGVPQTLSALFSVSVAVRLVLVIAGVELADQ
ncbi:MAG: poly-gamma-glutamate biosynthesis protein PgsC [Myxococcales bacterium]|nr:poly-gamma-glutamate biosynthesis protein PgsC [Myxococcales bacterium]